VGKRREGNGKKAGTGWGGRRANQGPPGNGNAMTTGAYALERLLKQGLDRDHPIGVLLTQRRDLYLSDLGGAEACSHMEQGLVDRLAKLDLTEALLDARLIDPATGKTRRLSWQRLHSLSVLRVRLTDSYTRTASALGIRRRERDVKDLATYLSRLPANEGAKGETT
jgi:hypothetical protein